VASSFKIIFALIVVLGFALSAKLAAQEQSKYKFSPAPDLWYNDVDGIRLGIRVLGEMEDSFKDGPHRLDAGLWLATWFPKTPVSYYLSFTEPLAAITSYGNEGSLEIVSLYRTGYTQQMVRFKKRWQPGFDELRYLEFRVSLSQEKLTDIEYRPFPQMWQSNWKTLLNADVTKAGFNGLGRYYIESEVLYNLNTTSNSFIVLKANVTQKINLGKHFALLLHGFAGHATDNTAPEYLFNLSYGQAQDWLNKGLSRAKGTIPTSFIESGLFQLQGGAGLRGYVEQEAKFLKAGNRSAYTSMWVINSELEFPNPINSAINSISVIGQLIEFRSYVLFDFGNGFSESPLTPIDPYGDIFALANAGIGTQFSINIPDYLGKDRGLFIRYDVPFWISKPTPGSNNFSYRQIIGIGAIFSF